MRNIPEISKRGSSEQNRVMVVDRDMNKKQVIYVHRSRLRKPPRSDIGTVDAGLFMQEISLIVHPSKGSQSGF